MKWIYGKQDIKMLERGQENCYLLTNGLGGFSSLTMIGSATRNDHALLMGCTQAPNHRYNLIHRLREVLETKKEKKVLSSQEFDGGTAEEGYQYLSSFTFEDTPVWRYETGGVQVRKEIGMPHMENTVAVVYEIENETLEAVTLQVTPFLQFVRKGEDLKEEQSFQCDGNSVISNGIELFFETNGEILQKEETETCYYSYDVCDGRRATGRTKAVLRISLRVPARKTGRLEIIASTCAGRKDAEGILADTKQYRQELEERAGFTAPMAKVLAKSAGQFVSRRESTDGKTILAGYPFFEDWGRDTMIALPGVCISTGFPCLGVGSISPTRTSIHVT